MSNKRKSQGITKSKLNPLAPSFIPRKKKHAIFTFEFYKLCSELEHEFNELKKNSHVQHIHDLI